LEKITLPPPRYSGRFSLERVVFLRRSVRECINQPLNLTELSQLLWSAQGITHPSGYRASPSAGARYPLEIYVLVGNVARLALGVYKYVPSKHLIMKISSEDKHLELRQAGNDQASLSDAGIVLVFCAIYQRTTGKYGRREIRSVHMEASHAAQNVYLQATSLQLGTVVLGAFDDDQVKTVLALKEEEPLCLMPVGKR
jgi:SagB-type dehydrogenase family enzyme